MGQWTLLNILFLLLLSKSNGQVENRRLHWRDRFRPFEDYIRLHGEHNPLEEVSDTPRFTLLAPDLLRTDIPVNIYLQADNVPSAITVTISIMDFTKTNMLLRDSARLGPENSFHTLKPIQLSSDRLDRDQKRDKFVNLRVTFGGYHAEDRVVMVSFHSGYIFIQTDKPVYNPGDTVHYRAFVSSPFFKAFEGTITIDIQNPEGVVIKQVSSVRAVNGIFPDTFVLSQYVSEGTWTLIVKFDHWSQNTFSSQFEVKKHVLPAFNVTLTPRKSFLDLQDTELAVEISARYLYGKTVQGTAYVVFGVKMNDQMTRLPSMKQVTNLDGGVVTLSMAEIRRAYPDIRSLVGNSVYVKASVLTKTGSDLVEAEKSGIKIVESPYVITFRDTAKYFKPGLPFDLAIQVSHHDGSPAHNVKVKVNLQDAPLIVSSGSTRTTINMPNDQRLQTITVETNQDGLRPEQQARQHITLQPYFAYNQGRRNYLYISTGSNKVSVGETLSLKLTINTADKRHRDLIKQITYLVINKGEIVTGELQDVTGQTVTSITVMVTADLMPSFRVVAFYTIPWAGLEEVVSDSIWMDVVDSCVGGLKVGPARDRQDYAPGDSFDLQIKGDPEARVSLVVVDNAVFLLKKDRLTQNKLWNTVEQGDIGCTRGGGKDAKGVFKDAGLLFASNAGVKTLPRQTLQCPGSARRRRSAELLQRKAQLESHYKEKLKQRCCKDGLREIRMPYSCTRRSLYITEGYDCMLAFRYCCATYRNQVYDTAVPTTPLPTTTAAPTPPIRAFGRASAMDFGPQRSRVALRRMEDIPGKTMIIKPPEVEALSPMGAPVQEAQEEDDLDFQDEDDLYVRSKFFETWLWTDVKLPSKTDSDGLASMTMTKTFPDSITEWGVLAVSGSPNTGFCVAEPYNMRVWKRFFVDLRLPYSVARNEQVEIKAVIHNYDTSNLIVRVILSKTEGMCSVAFKTRHIQQVQVQAGSSVAVPYTIVPLVVGKPALEVIVLAADESEGEARGGDRIRKTLRVVMEGVQKTEVVTRVLDPSAHGGSHTVRIGSIELESVVPNSSPETFMSVRGNLLADSIDNSISDDSLALLIRMPGGCVEQNLARMTLPLIATLYLDRSHTWQSVGVQRRSEAIGYIGRGYENQLVYKKKDGSYPPYKREGASTWITAYVVKVFSMAYTLIGVDKQQVCDPLLYLLQHKYQAFPGNFVEANPVYSTTMTGGHKGDDPDITLTAFVLIALAEARQAGIQCSHPGVSLEEIMTKTAGYLTRSLARAGRRPYTVAIASYALAMTRPSTPPNVLLSAAAPGGAHWPDRQSQFFTLEATGYALLALVKMGRIQEAKAPFNWLNSQRRRGGGFGPTQSTMVVLQALSEYLIKRPSPDDLSLDVDIRISGRREINAHFDTSTAYVARTSKLPANADLQVQAQGNGQGIVEVLTHYNQMHEVDEKRPCEHFELSVAIEESSETPPADAIKTYQLTIKVRALGPRDVRMVVLDISLPTGFTPENSDLELLSNKVDRYINNFQIVDNLSDRGSLILHVFKVAHREPDILMFRLQQRFKVGLLQPSSVTVYEYYDPDRRCTRNYSPKEDKEELKRICTDNVCRCTQGDCCISQPDNEDFSNKERETFACKSLHHVLKVKVLNVSHSYYDKYEMEITQVIKLGVEAGIRAGQRRFFMSHGVCSDGLSLNPGSHYLIIGPKDDQWKVDTETNGYIYMLGKDTWVELWPSPTDCSKPSLQTKCKNLNDAANELSSEGCHL